jgi:hypothetical protein
MGEMRPLFGRKTETSDRFRKGAIIFLVGMMDGAPTSVGFILNRKAAKAAKGRKEEGGWSTDFSRLHIEPQSRKSR